MHGTLTGDGCSTVVQSGTTFPCFLSFTPYQVSNYTYTDPSGQKYVIGANGALESLTDLNGNTLTYTPGGITSSAGNLSVPFMRDGQGRITLITDPQNNFDPTGAITDTYAYDAFGNTVAQAGSTFNQFQYRGEQLDSTLGLYYLRARYYRPQTGRFLTADKYEGAEMGCCKPCISGCSCNLAVNTPLTSTLLSAYRGPEDVQRKLTDPKSLHRYAYAEADPANGVDPSGDGVIMEWLMNVYYRVKFWINVMELGRDTLCSMVYAEEMAACSRMLSPMSYNCAAVATAHYTLCMGLGD